MVHIPCIVAEETIMERLGAMELQVPLADPVQIGEMVYAGHVFPPDKTAL